MEKEKEKAKKDTHVAGVYTLIAAIIGLIGAYYFGGTKINNDISENTPEPNQVSVLSNQDAPIYEGKQFTYHGDTNYFGRYNTDEAVIIVYELGVTETIGNNSSAGSYRLGIYPVKGATVYLVDYDSNYSIMEVTKNHDGQYQFRDIPPGKYYFAVESDNYEGLSSSGLFEIKYDEDLSTDYLLHHIYLNKIEANKSKEFTVQLYLNNEILTYQKVDFRLLVPTTKDYSDAFSSWVGSEYMTNHNGFLTQPGGVEPLKFVLYNNHSLLIIFKGEECLIDMSNQENVVKCYFKGN